MGSSSKKEKQKKKEALFDNLQLLRAVTNSSAQTNKESIIVDATKYIEELKEKVERLSHEESYYCCTSTAEAACTTTPTNTTTEASSSSTLNSLPMVKVETLEKGGFLINVVSENSCPGLLVWILEAFHELGLDVLDARVSCSDTFQFQAVGGGDVS
ncbi:Transcription factor SCREAM2 [Linum grandiflorum]